MRTSATAKAVIVAIPAGLWLARGHASPGRALLLAAGAALVAFAWTRLARGREADANAARAAIAELCDERARSIAREQHIAAQRQPLARVPSGRGPRDVRCPKRASARSFRSSRRSA